MRSRFVEFAGTLYLLLPLLGGAIFHGLCMKRGWLVALARPIDGGKTWRGRPLFGRTKTYRGPIAVAIGAALTWELQRSVLHGWAPLEALELRDYAALPGWWLGALAGAAAELAELPNSFVKRRAGVQSSGTARGLPSVLFYAWDQIDLLLGFWLVMAWAVHPNALHVLASVSLALALHPLITIAGYLLHMRPTAR